MSAKLPEKISAPELKTILKTAELRTQLLAQIEKDLELKPLSIDVTSESYFNDLNAIIKSVMQYKIEGQSQSVANIIYRVDLNELNVRRLLADPNTDASVALTEEIILREMKKVFYRNVYSGKIKL